MNSTLTPQILRDFAGCDSRVILDNDRQTTILSPNEQAVKYLSAQAQFAGYRTRVHDNPENVGFTLLTVFWGAIILD